MMCMPVDIGVVQRLLCVRMPNELLREYTQSLCCVVAVPAELLELVQARDSLGALNLELSARVLELAERLARNECEARPRIAALSVCEGLVRDCLSAWYDLQRAVQRICEAHRRLVARIQHGPALAEPMLAGLGEALHCLPAFFARAAQNQNNRGRQLLQHVATLERQAAQRSRSLGPKLRAALERFATHVTRDVSKREGCPGAPTMGL